MQRMNRMRQRMTNLVWNDIAVPVVFTVFVVMRAFDRVINKRIADILGQPAYNNVYSNIVFPIGGLIGQGLLSLGYIAFMRYYHKVNKYDFWFYSPKWKYASNKGAYWQVPLLILALMQNLSNLTNGISTAFLSQNMQSILQNLNIPFCMCGALLFLNTRFFANHYIACCTIIMAAFVSLSVALTPDARLCSTHLSNFSAPSPTEGVYVCDSQSSLNSYKDGAGNIQSTSAVWYLIFILSVAIQAGSNVYQQYILQGPDLEIMWSSFWVCVWQVPLGLLLLMSMWIPTTSPGVPPHQTGEAITQALTCFFGSVPVSTIPGITQADVQICGGEGGMSAFEWFIVYSFFNISFNVLLMWLTKYLSTTWAQIATILCLDIAGLLSMSPALQGGSASYPTISEWMGYVLAGLGLWMYNLQDEVDRTTGITKCLIHQKSQEEDGMYASNIKVGVENPALITSAARLV